VRGRVHRNEILIPIASIVPGHGDLAVECVLDTGFAGAIAISAAAARALRLRPEGTTVITLADGSRQVVDGYLADIRWNDTLTTVSVLSPGGEPQQPELRD
jgi:predicted aspartyl protease